MQRSGQTFVVDADLAIALTDDTGDDILADWARWRGPDGEELCFIACIPEWARETLAEEIDASEYGVNGVLNRKERAALRLIRSERAQSQADMHRRLREKNRG